MDTIDTTLVAAVIAACAALAAAGIAASSALRTRRAAERAQVWDRLSWVLREYEHSRAESDIPETVLDSLASLPWIDDDDRSLVVEILRELRPDHEEDTDDVPHTG